MRIICTGNYRKTKFFDIVNRIAAFLNDDIYQISLSDEFKIAGKSPHLNEKITIKKFSTCI